MEFRATCWCPNIFCHKMITSGRILMFHVSMEPYWLAQDDWIFENDATAFLVAKIGPHHDDPRGLEWPQVLNSLSVCLSVCLLVLGKFSNIISYDNILWFRYHMILYDIIWYDMILENYIISYIISYHIISYHVR